jgi:hypothetical protein
MLKGNHLLRLQHCMPRLGLTTISLDLVSLLHHQTNAPTIANPSSVVANGVISRDMFCLTVHSSRNIIPVYHHLLVTTTRLKPTLSVLAHLRRVF